MGPRACLSMLLLITSTACMSSTSARLRTDDSADVLKAHDDVARVALYTQSEIGRPYTIVGIVVAAADAGDDPKGPVAMLRKEAAALGADAVVDVWMEAEYGNMTGAVKLSGLAAKLQ